MRIASFSWGVSFLAFAPALAPAAVFAPAVRGTASSHDPAAKLLESAVTGQSGASVIAAAPTVLNFNGLAEGAVLSNQFAAQGVTFSADPAVASGTNMQATDVTTGDVGALGTPALVGGKLIHTFNGWLAETNDPNVLATFSSPVGFVSVDFAGNSNASTVPSEIDLYDSTSTLIGFVVVNPAGQPSVYQQTASFTSTSNNIAFAVVWPGEFNDWVGWDNFAFNTVPEPASLSLAALGGVLALRRRQRRR